MVSQQQSKLQSRLQHLKDAICVTLNTEQSAAKLLLFDFWLSKCLPDLQRRYAELCFFSLRHFGHFFLRHFGHRDIAVICTVAVVELSVTLFIGLYFWPNWLNFFRSFRPVTEERPRRIWPRMHGRHTRCCVSSKNSKSKTALSAVENDELKWVRLWTQTCVATT